MVLDPTVVFFYESYAVYTSWYKTSQTASIDKNHKLFEKSVVVLNLLIYEKGKNSFLLQQFLLLVVLLFLKQRLRTSIM